MFNPGYNLQQEDMADRDGGLPCDLPLILPKASMSVAAGVCAVYWFITMLPPPGVSTRSLANKVRSEGERDEWRENARTRI